MSRASLEMAYKPPASSLYPFRPVVDIKGELRFADVRRLPIRQGAGEWYYQKFAEIYMMGQKIGDAAGKKMQGLANELFDAARNGEIAAMVGKSNVKLDS